MKSWRPSQALVNQACTFSAVAYHGISFLPSHTVCGYDCINSSSSAMSDALTLPLCFFHDPGQVRRLLAGCLCGPDLFQQFHGVFLYAVV